MKARDYYEGFLQFIQRYALRISDACCEAEKRSLNAQRRRLGLKEID